MKKLSLLFVMLIAMTIGVKAQGHFIVPTVGFNTSGVVVSNDEFYILGDSKTYHLNEYLQMRVGVSAGVDYRYEFKKPFVLELGFQYDTYGFGLNDVVSVNKVKYLWDYTCTFQHISIPVMFGYKFVIGKSKVFSITPKIGLQFGWYLSANARYNTLGYNSGTHTYFYDKENSYNYTQKINDGFDVAEMIACEFGWHLNKVLDIFVDVNERYSFTSVKNGSRTTFNYCIGANFGLRIKVGE